MKKQVCKRVTELVLAASMVLSTAPMAFAASATAENLALEKTATGTPDYYTEPGQETRYTPDKAVDGDPATCWGPVGNAPEVGKLTVDLGSAETFNTVVFRGRSYDTVSRTQSVKVLISDSADGEWKEIASKDCTAADMTLEFDEQTAQYVQVQLIPKEGQPLGAIAEMEVYFLDDEHELPKEFKSVSVPGSPYVKSGSTITLQPKCLDSNGEEISNDLVKFSYESSAPEIATVSDDGVVTGVSKGRSVVTIRAEYGGKSLSFQKTVYCDYIAPEPQGDKEEPSKEQQDMIENRNYGLMMHFGINTFNGVQWSDGTLPVSSYDPETVDADQWARVAKNAGMTHIVLVSMHHDGFCMWDTKTTDYKCTNPESGNTTDVIKAMAEACEKYGIKLGLYYSLWNRHEVFENDLEHLQFMKDQFSELLGGEYGEICEIWLDGGWDKSPERWYLPELYDHIKTLQPECQVGVNQTIGDASGIINPSDYEKYDPIKYFPTDFKTWDGQTIKDYDEPKIFTYEGENYYLPYEETVCVRNPFGGFSWFWHPGYNEGEIYPAEMIQQSMEKLHSRDNVFLLNMGIDRTGHMVDSDIAAVYKAADLLGIAEGEAVGANNPLTEEELAEMEALLRGYEEMDASLYTQASYQVLLSAVNAAREQLEEGTMKHADLAGMKNQLKQAADSLVLLTENDNLALGMKVTGDPGPWNGSEEFLVEHAVDGNPATLWGPYGKTDATLLIDFGKETTFNRVQLDGRASDTVGRTKSYDIYAGDSPETLTMIRENVPCEAVTTVIDFEPHTAQYLQIRIHAKGNDLPSFTEISAYYAGDKTSLQALYDQYVQTINDGYSSSSWETFQNALAKAKRILAMNGPSQELLDETAKELTSAYEGLSHAPSSVTYVIKAEQSQGGKISPSSRSVARGGNVTFTIEADDGYVISDVLVDGKSVGAVESYTFKNVSSKHTIAAEFTPDSENAKPVAGFTDVTEADWFADAVEYVVDAGLMNGTSATTFSPKGDTTRGMIVTILYRLAGSPEVESDGATWWSDARIWAMEEGISDGTNMEGKITREQLAAMLYRYAGSEAVKGDLSAFTDASSVSDWAVDALIWATSNGIVTGKTGNILDPSAGATRAETAAMLMRYCELDQ